MRYIYVLDMYGKLIGYEIGKRSQGLSIYGFKKPIVIEDSAVRACFTSSLGLPSGPIAQEID